MGVISKIKKIKCCVFPSRNNIGSAGKNAIVGVPCYIGCPKTIHMEENTALRPGAIIQNTSNEHIYIKKYTAIGIHCTIVTNSHRATVGIPQVILGPSHINDVSKDLHIDEDVWVGTNVTILAGGDLGRGCVVGASSTVTKPVPPYALVVGSPAKIAGVKFTIDQILEHEKTLYPESERFSRKYLEELFAKYYEGKKVIGNQTEFTEDIKAKLEIGKRMRNFIEPDLSPSPNNLLK